MKYAISLLFSLSSLFSMAQVPIAEIEGRLSIYLPDDTTSVHIGKNAGLDQNLLAPGYNTYIGTDAGKSAPGLIYNTYLGYRAGAMSGNNFTCLFGASAGEANTGSSSNFFGVNAGKINSGDYNNFYGTDAGITNQSGIENSFFGHRAGLSNTSGNENSFFGNFTGHYNQTGIANSYFGSFAGQNNREGFSNSYFGRSAGYNIKEGSHNICIGATSGPEFSDSIQNTRLFIDIQVDSDPLIYGEFDNDLIRINGDFHSTGKVLLENNQNVIFKEADGITEQKVLSLDDNDHTILNAENDIIFNSGGTIAGAFRAMTIKADNKVGIGTTQPLWKTVIKETANAIISGATIDVSNLATVFAKESNDNNEGVGIGFQSSSDEENVGAAIVHERTGASSLGKLHFGSKTTTGAGDDIQVNMTISDDGNIGIGTTSPKWKVDVRHSENALIASSVIDVSNLAMVLAKESNNNDEGIGIGFQSSNNLDNVGAAIVHERTGSGSKGKLHFSTKTTTAPGDNLVTSLTISDDGKVGLGNTSPTERLHVIGDARISGLALSGLVDVQADNNGVLVKAVSDIRLKKDIEKIEGALNKVLALRGVTYNWKEGENQNKTLGVIAQEVVDVVPELVNFDGTYYGVNYSEFPALLIEAIKEQQTIIESQGKNITSLKSQLENRDQQFASLLSRVEQLENGISTPLNQHSTPLNQHSTLVELQKD